MTKFLLVNTLLAILFCSCSRQQTVTNRNDYAQFLNPAPLQQAVAQKQAGLAFWENRLKRDTGNWVDMLEVARQQLSLFRLRADPQALVKADSLMRRSSEKLGNTDAELLLGLSQLSITRHRFRDAADFLRLAGGAKPDAYTHRLLQFDTQMELGQYADAWNNLQRLQDQSTFDYIIRRAKWEDHRGRTDAALLLMEQAAEKVKGKQEGLYCWALSSLADMYGHAGRIKEAYQAYLNVLREDPLHVHSLLGIARIAWVHDGNTAAAREITRFITAQTSMPESLLILAEIAGEEGDLAAKKELLLSFEQKVTEPVYGGMYHKYLLELYADELNQPAKAVQLAALELEQRFTPETCDWMAWAAFRNGDLQEAYRWARGYVYRRTFEPDALLHSATIFAAAGKKREARELLNTCLESSYELGPSAVRGVREQLTAL